MTLSNYYDLISLEEALQIFREGSKKGREEADCGWDVGIEVITMANHHGLIVIAKQRGILGNNPLVQASNHSYREAQKNKYNWEGLIYNMLEATNYLAQAIISNEK